MLSGVISAAITAARSSASARRRAAADTVALRLVLAGRRIQDGRGGVLLGPAVQVARRLALKAAVFLPHHALGGRRGDEQGVTVLGRVRGDVVQVVGDERPRGGVLVLSGRGSPAGPSGAAYSHLARGLEQTPALPVVAGCAAPWLHDVDEVVPGVHPRVKRLRTVVGEGVVQLVHSVASQNARTMRASGASLR